MELMLQLCCCKQTPSPRCSVMHSDIMSSYERVTSMGSHFHRCKPGCDTVDRDNQNCVGQSMAYGGMTIEEPTP